MLNSPIRIRARARARARNLVTLCKVTVIGGFVLILALLAKYPSPLPPAEPAMASLPSLPVIVEGVVKPEIVGRELSYIDIGEWTITAYCPCEKCCGVWAKNRSNGVVYGAYGDELQSEYSCAAPLPHGTTLDIEGLGRYVVQDTTSDEIVEWYNGKIVDIYHLTHEEAAQFGKLTAEIRIVR